MLMVSFECASGSEMLISRLGYTRLNCHFHHKAAVLGEDRRHLRLQHMRVRVSMTQYCEYAICHNGNSCPDRRRHCGRKAKIPIPGSGKF